MKSFFVDGRIVAIYEPFSRLANGYNFNLLFRSHIDILIEVVGPGFDASNLQRGDVTPHEVFNAQTTRGGEVLRFVDVYHASAEQYRLSVRDRIRKLQEHPTSAVGRNQRTHFDLLAIPETYERIPRDLVRETIKAIARSRFIDRFAEHTGTGFPLNISTSYVNGGARQVFWDAVSPALKFQGL